MTWDIIDTGISLPEKNMQLDQELLNRLDTNSNCILHLYEWKGACATHGYFIDPAKYLNPKGLIKHGVQLARRPTGGGIIFHQFDLAFSALVPASHPGYSLNTLDNYAFINNSVANAIKKFMGGQELPSFLQKEESASNEACKHFCMAKPTIYDVMIDGRKVGGGAQRRTKVGFLHQGSIALSVPSDAFLEDIIKLGSSPDIINAMRQNSYPLLIKGSKDELQEARVKLREALIQSFNTMSLS